MLDVKTGFLNGNSPAFVCVSYAAVYRCQRCLVFFVGQFGQRAIKV
jgi:hypothetical protein